IIVYDLPTKHFPETLQQNAFGRGVFVLLTEILPVALTWVTLCNNFVPISLVVMLEVGRNVQRLYIVWDKEFWTFYFPREVEETDSDEEKETIHSTSDSEASSDHNSLASKGNRRSLTGLKLEEIDHQQLESESLLLESKSA
ncbi:unnamed protein product, partial [Amoebophrya sp. A25]